MTPCWPSPARRTCPAPDPSIARPATLSRSGRRRGPRYQQRAQRPTWPAYAPLLKGGYVSQDKPAAAESGHPGTPARLAALREVANDAGATVNQVVLARLTGAEVPVIPLTGASSAAQLDQSPAAADPELTTEQRTRLDAAR